MVSVWFREGVRNHRLEGPCVRLVRGDMVGADQLAAMFVEQITGAIGLLLRINEADARTLCLPVREAGCPTPVDGCDVFASERVVEGVEEFQTERRDAALPVRLGAVRRPLVADQGNRGRLEVGAVCWLALPRLPELKGEADVGHLVLDGLHMHDGVELPLLRLIAVGLFLIVTGVMYPELTDVALRERSNPRHNLRPGFAVLHVAGQQAHDCVELDEVDAADRRDDLVDLRLPFWRVEGLEFFKILAAQRMEAGRNFANPVYSVTDAVPIESSGHFTVDIQAASRSLSLPMQEVFSGGDMHPQRHAKIALSESCRCNQYPGCVGRGPT